MLSSKAKATATMSTHTISGREHHFFLFRHCIRSPNSNVVDVDEFSEDIRSYFTEPFPHWNVPPMWCTEGGGDIAEQLGGLVWKDHIAHSRTKGSSNKLKIQIEMISDESQRDADTTYSLAMGMEEAMDSATFLSSGVHAPAYDYWLFHPDEFCSLDYTDRESGQYIAKRFAKLKPPELNVASALQRLKEILGEGKESVDSITKPVKLIATKDDVGGAVNFLARLGEILYWARGSRIPFAPRATNEDVYKLLQWQDYKRSVLEIDNPRAAYHGAIMSNAMLHVLRSGYYEKQKQHEDESYDARVTIAVGHDVDLDGLATVLGLDWELKPPYMPSPPNSPFVPTPPLSGIHIKRNLDTGHVSLSLLYPILSDPVTGKWFKPDAAKMDSVPLNFHDTDMYTSLDNTTTYMEFPDAVDRLERHIQTQLSGYKGAQDCFDQATSYRAALMQPSIEYENDITAALVIGFSMGVVTMVALLVSVFCCVVRARRGKKIILLAEDELTLPETNKGSDNDYDDYDYRDNEEDIDCDEEQDFETGILCSEWRR